MQHPAQHSRLTVRCWQGATDLAVVESAEMNVGTDSLARLEVYSEESEAAVNEQISACCQAALLPCLLAASVLTTLLLLQTTSTP